jgi:hypothetical protein
MKLYNLSKFERKILLRALDEWEWQGSHGKLGGAGDKSDQVFFDTIYNDDRIKHRASPLDSFFALEQKLSRETDQ